MLSKKMAPQQEKKEKEARERSEWRKSLNSIMEGFNSLPNDEGNFTGQTPDKGKGQIC